MENDFLYLRRLGIDTHQEPVVYMRRDCHVCRAEGFNAQARISVNTDNSSIIATLNIINSDFLSHQEVGLSESAWQLLGANEGEKAHFAYARPVDSMSYVRGKLYGKSFQEADVRQIIGDIKERRYSDIQLAAYVTACAGNSLSRQEIIAITKAMIDSGRRLDWGGRQVMDKHCVGGLPGNRTTPIVVAIVCANGLLMPKTSSRAITSPSGTADTMEVLAPVTLSYERMREVVESEGGCIAWGGSVNLSPVDDIIIRVERALDLDSEGQLIASVISKKVAAGSTHVLIDIPIGATAKVRNLKNARQLSEQLLSAGEALGLEVKTVYSDGSQPVGRGIGPALEARDIMAVLQQSESAPADLQERAIALAAAILEMSGLAAYRQGQALALQTLQSGKALKKFIAICEAQGGLREPPQALYTHTVLAEYAGVVAHMHTNCIAKLAKLAGAPAAKAAGLDMHVQLGDHVERGSPLFTLHADAKGELRYALDFLATHPEAVRIEEEVL